MTDPDILQAEPDTEPEFNQHRSAAELQLAIKDDPDGWFFMEKGTFVAVARNDGAAAVLGTAKGWQVQQYPDGKTQVTQFASAADAVTAAKAVGA